MCRSIKTLRGHDLHPSDEEIAAAARQFVRKVSGFHKPSRRNEAVFEAAVQEVAAATSRMLESLHAAAHAAPTSLERAP